MYQIKRAFTKAEKLNVKTFLKKFLLEYDIDIEYSIYIEVDNTIVGTLSLSKDIIKDVAVDDAFKGENLTGILVNEAISYLRENKIYYYQVFTKPLNKDIFISLGFNEIVSTKNICMLESGITSITQELTQIKNTLALTSNDIGCAVLNCNPLTNGHLFLIETIAKKHKVAIIFIVEEDLSEFKFSDRISIVKKSVAHLKNVIVLPSTRYIISRSTFPTYFLKENTDIAMEHALLDAEIFEKYFVKIFNIAMRYVGTEENSQLTNTYNNALKQVLSNKLTVLNRLSINGEIVSASVVRALIKNKNLTKIKTLVPVETLQFIKSNYIF